MISRQTIDEILLRTDIQTLIGGYVSLKRAGSNLKGLCPFHSEKSPSFTVYPQNNSFYCFGCGAGGDQISFVMRIERLDYPDAIQFLAKRAGVTVVDDNQSKYSNEPRFDRQRMFKMNVDAAKYFNAMLFSDDPDAKNALAYFTEKRKLSVATIKHFGLGFAPNSYDRFSKYMLSRGYTYDELVAGFLCGKTDKGHYFDAFRNRVMFPIIDVSGNVIAFGGRVMDDSKPKYKNSSDTPVFKKSRNLFALNFARMSCKDSLILCEGYMDVIALHSVGISNAVAALGTAITSEQARIMKNYTDKVVICYDSDEAGQKAASRAMKLLGEVGLEVNVLNIPGAKDPDEFIKTYGVDKFREVIGEAKSKFQYNLDLIMGKYNIMMPQDRINALHDLERYIATVPSAAERDVYIRHVSTKLEVDFKSMKTDVDRLVMASARAFKKNESLKARQNAGGYADRINPDFIKAPAVARNEETVLGLMLLYEEHRSKVFTKQLLYEDDFLTDFNRRIFKYLKSAFESGDSLLGGINAEFSEDEIGRISQMKVGRMKFSSNGDGELDECIDSLKKSVQKKNSEKTNTIDDLNERLRLLRNKSD